MMGNLFQNTSQTCVISVLAAPMNWNFNSSCTSCRLLQLVTTKIVHRFYIFFAFLQYFKGTTKTVTGKINMAIQQSTNVQNRNIILQWGLFLEVPNYRAGSSQIFLCFILSYILSALCSLLKTFSGQIKNQWLWLLIQVLQLYILYDLYFYLFIYLNGIFNQKMTYCLN